MAAGIDSAPVTLFEMERKHKTGWFDWQSRLEEERASQTGIMHQKEKMKRKGMCRVGKGNVVLNRRYMPDIYDCRANYADEEIEEEGGQWQDISGKED